MLKQRKLRCMATALGLTMAIIAGTATPAFAADQGNWQGGSCWGWGRGCFWRSSTSDFSLSQYLESNTRDSHFNNDYWANTTTTLNDRAKYFGNGFTSLNVAAYKNFSYSVLTWCLPPGWLAGPFSTGISDGLSSFKSC